MSDYQGVDLSASSDAPGVLAIRGPDAARFLQGQLSADIEKLAPATSTLAGLHNPQGRVIALLALARTAPEEILAVLPRELLDAVAARLRKYVMRAKARIDDDSAAWSVLGTDASITADGLPLIAWGSRRLLLVPAAQASGHACSGTAAAQWLRADVAEGLPQVYAATSETFVAQMLNLDLLGGIAFDKGCYTGQEVIARAHYRGRVKRRLQRWLNASPVALAPGDSARAADGRTLSVVRVAPRDAAGQELLAVGTFAEAMDDPAAAGNTAEAASMVSGPLPLPYPLPA